MTSFKIAQKRLHVGAATHSAGDTNQVSEAFGIGFRIVHLERGEVLKGFGGFAGVIVRFAQADAGDVALRAGQLRNGGREFDTGVSGTLGFEKLSARPSMAAGITGG